MVKPELREKNIGGIGHLKEQMEFIGPVKYLFMPTLLSNRSSKSQEESKCPIDIRKSFV